MKAPRRVLQTDQEEAPGLVLIQKREKMSELKELLIENLQDLLSAEKQLVTALPKMAGAAGNARLKQAFEKHLVQTEGHVERLKLSLQILGSNEDSRACKGMKGLLEEGQEVIEEGKEMEALTADLALIAAAQKVEHYEISGYGTARCLAKLLGERKVATLLSHTLGEEEAADFILTDLSQPLLQQALSAEFGAETKAPWGEPGETRSSNPTTGNSKVRSATAGASSARKRAS
jgi:Mn-containing catalase